MSSKDQSRSPQNKYQKVRRNTRIFLVQCFYAWHFTRGSVESITTSVREGQLSTNDGDQLLPDYVTNIDEAYFQKIFKAFIVHIDEVDFALTPCLTRDIALLGGVERAILRLATLELSETFALPSRVVMNEAIELAKSFGATESFKFINGALHALSQKVPLRFSSV